MEENKIHLKKLELKLSVQLRGQEVVTITKLSQKREANGALNMSKSRFKKKKNEKRAPNFV